MEINSAIIASLAPDANAAKNGRELVAKNKFLSLKISPDKTVIWGDCAGSGSRPYRCSYDFVDENKPVPRCSCPSRQFPCKHAIGLLYAREQGKRFEEDAIPEDIASKREKIEKRLEKKETEKESIREKADKPKKVNTAAFVKKIDVQLSGIEIARKILVNIVRSGLSSVAAQEIRTLNGQVKELGNYYIGGIQTAFNHLILALEDVRNEEYTIVIDQVNYLSALLAKSAEYLNRRRENPELPPELDSTIEEQIGYTWKLTELMQYGQWEENAAILQLSFNSYDNPARKEWVDEGIWFNLKNGHLYKTKNYRPYKAAKYIREDNTTYGTLLLKELYIYPGAPNPRIRWEPDAIIRRDVSADDRAAIHASASRQYADTVKAVKNVIRNPLADKHPVVLLALHKAFLSGKHILLEDAHGNRLTLGDTDNRSSVEVLKTMLPADPAGMSLLVMMHHDVRTGLLFAQPLSLALPEKIIRLFY
jgi:hypothetical protein